MFPIPDIVPSDIILVTAIVVIEGRNTNVSPAKIADLELGIVMFLIVCHFFAPKSILASSKSLFLLSRETYKGNIMNGR